jgi:hypothetical protein
MADTRKPHETVEQRVEEATEWLNDKLSPYIGAAQLGPFGPDLEPPVSFRRCPICGYPMGEHIVEEDTDGRIYLHHPDDRFHEVMETGHRS